MSVGKGYCKHIVQSLNRIVLMLFESYLADGYVLSFRQFLMLLLLLKNWGEMESSLLFIGPGTQQPALVLRGGFSLFGSIVNYSVMKVCIFNVSKPL